jgi:hypothetical protein
MARLTLTLLSAVILIFIGFPGLCFGYLGVSGRLTDTDRQNNLMLGLMFLGLGLLGVTPAVLCVFLWKRPGRSRRNETRT